MIIAGECKECGGDMLIVDTRTSPNYHDCECGGCGRKASIPWGISVQSSDKSLSTVPSSDKPH